MNQNLPMLDEKNLLKNPIRQFEKWFQEAKECREIFLPEAMCLSTVDVKGRPGGRMVLLKGFDENGFVFYTNILSPKGKDLSKNSQAALTFYWERLKRQVRITGKSHQVSAQEADAYFKSRPRESQIGAWASAQSEVLESRAVLENKFQEFDQKFKGGEVPRPAYWTGFCVVPEEIEFWQECPNRLHDRFLFTMQSKRKWKIERLFP